MNKKEVEWLHLNRSLLDVYEISGFIFATKEAGNETSQELYAKCIMPSYKDEFDNFLLFSKNIFISYAITEIHKIINPDSFQQSITLFSFIKEYFSDKNSKESKNFYKWKKENRKIRKKIELARKKYSAHSDSESIHGNIYFDLGVEETDAFIQKTFLLFDYLYINNSDLKNIFDKEINRVGTKLKPSETAEGFKKIMLKRIKVLKGLAPKDPIFGYRHIK